MSTFLWLFHRYSVSSFLSFPLLPSGFLCFPWPARCRRSLSIWSALTLIRSTWHLPPSHAWPRRAWRFPEVECRPSSGCSYVLGSLALWWGQAFPLASDVAFAALSPFGADCFAVSFFCCLWLPACFCFPRLFVRADSLTRPRVLLSRCSPAPRVAARVCLCPWFA